MQVDTRVPMTPDMTRRQGDYMASTKLESRTPQTISLPQVLRVEPERVRAAKISPSIGENSPESAAIAAPVFDAYGNVAAAIAIGGPTERLQSRIAELRPLIADVAARASGHRPA